MNFACWAVREQQPDFFLACPLTAQSDCGPAPQASRYTDKGLELIWAELAVPQGQI